MSKYKYKMYQLSGPLMTSGAGSSKSGTIIVDCSQEQWAQLWSWQLASFQFLFMASDSFFPRAAAAANQGPLQLLEAYPSPACADL